jgi:micrococcal nuclease
MFSRFNCCAVSRLVTYEDTIPFVMPITGGQVVKVYDGDTITIASKLPYKKSPLYRFSVRLNGIDCPEIKGKTDDEISIAKEARDKLSAMIMNKQVILKNVATEKYGRVLADVYLDNLHINQWLIDSRLAVKYDGGTKNAPESWTRYYVTGSNHKS